MVLWGTSKDVKIKWFCHGTISERHIIILNWMQQFESDLHRQIELTGENGIWKVSQTDFELSTFAFPTWAPNKDTAPIWDSKYN